MSETASKDVKPNLFAKAAGRTAAAPKKAASKGVTWSISPLVTDAPTKDELNSSVSEMHRLTAERKRIETEEGVHKSRLKSWASERYVDHLVRTGCEPETPLRIVNDKHESVTYVVTDRAHLTKVTDEQEAAMVDLLGADVAEQLVYEAGEFKFSPAVMAQLAVDGSTTVQDVVAGALTEALAGLVESGKLHQEQVDGLLEYVQEKRWRPQLLQQVVQVCGKNAKRISEFFGVVSTAITTYVRV